MNKIIYQIILFGCTFSYVGFVYSTNIPNRDDPSTFLGPTLKGSYTSSLFTDNAFSVLGEAGIKHFRVGGTYGWQWVENQRLKLSAEYLRQKITYAFFSGNTDQWVDQGAVGLGYQLDLGDSNYAPQFDLSFYYAYAPSKNLNTVNGTFLNSAGAQQVFADQRRIAGSNAAGVEPGITFQPWMSGQMSLGVNYDHVHYRKRYSPSENANGLGGTIRFMQGLSEGLNLDLSATVRQPFNHYFAKLAWKPASYSNWRFGIDGSYTVGKDTLPNTYNAGIDIDYLFDCASMHHTAMIKNLKGETTITAIPANRNHLLNWVADPAVYMPQVLAIADGNTTLSCTNNGSVTVIAPIEGDTIVNAGSVIFPTASSFAGDNLTFSMTEQTTVDPGLSTPIISINSANGDVTVVVPGPFGATGSSLITVTASNGCSSASASFVVNYILD